MLRSMKYPYSRATVKEGSEQMQATAAADDPVKKITKGRIPLALQAVFLASNRGEEVHIPPPGKVANRIFPIRSWFKKRREEKSKQQDQEQECSEATDGTTPIAYVNRKDKLCSKAAAATKKAIKVC